jgi:hypothetical protein
VDATPVAQAENGWPALPGRQALVQNSQVPHERGGDDTAAVWAILERIIKGIHYQQHVVLR